MFEMHKTSKRENIAVAVAIFALGTSIITTYYQYFHIDNTVYIKPLYFERLMKNPPKAEDLHTYRSRSKGGQSTFRFSAKMGLSISNVSSRDQYLRSIDLVCQFSVLEGEVKTIERYEMSTVGQKINRFDRMILEFPMTVNYDGYKQHINLKDYVIEGPIKDTKCNPTLVLRFIGYDAAIFETQIIPFPQGIETLDALLGQYYTSTIEEWTTASPVARALIRANILPESKSYRYYSEIEPLKINIGN